MAEEKFKMAADVCLKSPEPLKSMGIPEDYKIAAASIVGYPKNIPKFPARLEPQILNIIH